MRVYRLERPQRTSSSKRSEISRGIIAGRMRGDMMLPQGGLRHVDRWSNQYGCDRDEHRQRNGCPERTLDTHRATTGKEPDALLPDCAEAGCVTWIHLLQLKPETHKEPINFADSRPKQF